MPLTDRIRAAAARDGFALDPQQEALAQLLASTDDSVYIHGPVGRGKSWIADAFAAAAAEPGAGRVHFHGFLDELHRAVFARQTEVRARRLATQMGRAAQPEGSPVIITTGRDSSTDVLDAAPVSDGPDPVEEALDEVVGRARLLVFDEFHVHDPGDARLLTRLLEHALRRGIRIVATSNYAPADLLPDPVWHHIAEPGIRLIEEHMRHVHLDAGADYRERGPVGGAGFASGSWTTDPLAVPEGAHELRVRDRSFVVAAATDEGLWITFAQLCAEATSTIEYLEWARAFPRWTILDVPAFDEVPAPHQQRFLSAIDVLVDADVPTTITSSVDLEAFAASAAARPDAPRLVSRLRLLRR